MAFVDTLLAETTATVAIVDRYHRPGGHWTTAYPFVRLHQPSAFYGVNSKPLGHDSIDQVGWNKGLYELATGDEVLAYYDQVMNQHFLPSGRVQYFPNCSYSDDGRITSLVSGKTFQLAETCSRIVDATYSRVKVPSMGPPAYNVAPGIPFVTPNGLAKTARAHANYTVIGAGKTGIDTCLWLLSRGVEPAQIAWVVPRDSWLLDRSAYQPGPAFAERRYASLPAHSRAIMEATSVDDLFRRLEASHELLRLTDTVWPTMYRCATVSLAELEQLRKIHNVVRQGRVLSIGTDAVNFEDGSRHQPQPDTLFIDCSADGLEKRDPVPVFNGKHITLQAVRLCQQVFSAAFIAHAEAAYDDEETKNQLCRPIPHPDESSDWLVITLLNNENTARWLSQPKTASWLAQARLDWFSCLVPPMPKDPEQSQKVLQHMAVRNQGVCDKIRVLIDQLPLKERERIQRQILRDVSASL